jgi:lycopene beta-cyclase
VNPAVWDVVIVGGGLAGLSLAVELAQPHHAHLRVLVLEQRTHYQRDRTWSYWSAQPHRYSALERRRWQQWAVSFDGQRQVQTTKNAHGAQHGSYCTLDADAFYAFAVAQISAAPHIHLRMGCPVRSVVPALLPVVRLEDGRQETACWVMDARPAAMPPTSAAPATSASTAAAADGSAGLSQHFVGWEIHTATDCFDAGVVELMDFQAASAGLHFFYVLPYSRRSALVESTWISGPTQQPDYAAELRGYLRQRYGLQAYDCVYREQGRLPLQHTPSTNANPRIVKLGQAAGTLRASTGFAFLETIADAQRIAECLRRSPPNQASIPAFRRQRLDAWMDSVLLAAMAAQWTQAPRFFMALFGGTRAQTLLPFLAGRATLRQRLSIALPLPKRAFLRAAWQVLRS